MNIPKIGICITAYESPMLLKRALDSIFSQTYKNYTIFITDNSVTNSVQDYIGELEGTNIIYLRNIPPLSVSGNINRAIQLALEHKVDYIKILFQDDWFSSETSLETMVYHLKKSNADVLFVGNYEAYPNNIAKHICSPNTIMQIENDLSFLFRANHLGAPSNIIYRSVSCFFDSSFTWLLDVDFYLNLLSNKKLEYIYEPLITIGHDGDQLTDFFYTHPLKMFVETYHLYIKHRWLHTFQNKKYMFKQALACLSSFLKSNLKLLFNKLHSIIITKK